MYVHGSVLTHTVHNSWNTGGYSMYIINNTYICMYVHTYIHTKTGSVWDFSSMPAIHTTHVGINTNTDAICACECGQVGAVTISVLRLHTNTVGRHCMYI